VSSDPATITSAGRYCWRADFSGDAAKGVPSSSDSRESECFLINPRQPTLSTQAVDADGTAISAAVPFGSTIYDTATLGNTANKPGSGGPAGSTNGSIDPATAGGAATGTITFKLYGPGTDATACNTLATGFPAAGIVVNVSGDNTYGGAGSTPPVSFVPQSPGVYHWKADYSGDLPNTLSASHNSGCTDTNEDVTVQRIDTEILTNQSVYPNDSATITSALASDNLPATGTVIFRLYDNATCTDDDDVIGATGLLYKETKTGVGGSHSVTVGTNNTTIAVSADGTVYWKVTYATGDQAHTGRQSDCIENTTLAFVNDAGPGTLFP